MATALRFPALSLRAPPSTRLAVAHPPSSLALDAPGRRVGCSSRRRAVITCTWRRKDTRNITGRANSLLATLRSASDVREEVYAALDAWAAFQLDFPILAIKRALAALRQQQEWKRILQVCKWMWARGQGRTYGSMAVMMEAMGHLQRHAELDGMWDRILAWHRDSVPRSLFAQVMRTYSLHNRPLKVIEVYGSMQALDVRLDEGMAHLVLKAFMAVGASQHAHQFHAAHLHLLQPSPARPAIITEQAQHLTPL